MEVKFNLFWGLIGFLGILGYILGDPAYYIFFVFFLLFLEPVFRKKEENNDKPSRGSYHRINQYNITIWIGSAILVIVALALIIGKTMNDYLAVGMLLGAMIFLSSFLQYIGMEKPARDERVRKIGTLSTTYSWYVTLIFVCFLLVTGYWSGVPRTPAELLGVTIFVMVVTMLGINTYLNWRGDVE